jgi:2-phosphosulfolactate phosphatase
VSASTTRFDVALLPAAAEPLEDTVVVVVDVLRATTTIVSALANGAAEVIPAPSVEAARELHQKLGASSIIGGERQGKIVDGFHQGNSPVEYTPEVVAGKRLILATTNGTVAMEQCRAAREVIIGAMVNVDAVADRVYAEQKVCVMCSGTDRIITSEDVCFAGLLMQRIVLKRMEANLEQPFLTDAATIALDHWHSVDHQVQDGTPLADFFRAARGGINLVRIGHDEDIVFASNIDSFTSVPVLDLEQWTIR